MDSVWLALVFTPNLVKMWVLCFPISVIFIIRFIFYFIYLKHLLKIYATGKILFETSIFSPDSYLYLLLFWQSFHWDGENNYEMIQLYKLFVSQNSVYLKFIFKIFWENIVISEAAIQIPKLSSLYSHIKLLLFFIWSPQNYVLDSTI